MTHLSRFAKFYAALFGGLATWGATAAATGGITLAESFGVFGVLATAFGVFTLTNAPIGD